jgi:hypothetical protein
MNIVIKEFDSERGSARCKTRNPEYGYENQKRYEYFKILVQENTIFVENDTNKGSFERAKYHFRNKVVTGATHYRENVFVLDKLDRQAIGFGCVLCNDARYHPEQRMVVSKLLEKPRKPVQVMVLVRM